MEAVANPAVVDSKDPNASVDQTVEDPNSDLNDTVKDPSVSSLPARGFLHSFTEATDVERLKQAWPRVKSYLTDNGLESYLELDTAVFPGQDAGFLAAWKPAVTDDLSIAKACFLSHMLTDFDLHPSLALEIISDRRRHRFIQIGTQGDGLCALYGIEHDEFVKRRDRIIDSTKAVYSLTGCTLYVGVNSVIAVGDDSFKLQVADYLVKLCMILGFHPVSVIKTMDVYISHSDGSEFCSWRIGFGPFFSKLNKGEVEMRDKFEPWEEAPDGPFSFSYSINDETKKVCEEHRKEVDSFMTEHDITWTLDSDRMTVSTTSRDPKVGGKARRILILLASANLLPSRAIDTLKGKEQYVIIDIGAEGGLCSKYSIDEGLFSVRKERLMAHLQQIIKLTRCHTHIDGDTVISVGTSAGVEMVRMFVESCIVHGIYPESFISMIQRPGGGDMGAPVSSFSQAFEKCDEAKLLDAWPMVEFSLKEHGISCQLNVDDCIMTVSTTEETRDPSSSIVKAKGLLELLATSGLPASLAIELMNGHREHVFIKIGTQEGGLCSKFGINQDDFKEGRDRLNDSLQDITELTDCDIYISEDTFTAVSAFAGAYNAVGMAKTLVEACIIYNKTILREPHDTHCGVIEEVGTMKRKREFEESISYEFVAV